MSDTVVPTTAVIDELVQRIVDAVHALRIVPFGSAARGETRMAIDLAPDRTFFGTELLNANEQLRGEDVGRLLVVNEATGVQTALPISAS